MLSEHETLELLEQLKIGSLTGGTDDPVGHWPILIGDGLCLNLQSAANGEFARQPDKVTVEGGLTPDTTLGDICGRYRQIHHLSTGLHDRSLLIGYTADCLAFLPRLHVTESNLAVVTSSSEFESDTSCAYDFSVAIAASLDPSSYGDHDVIPVSFLPLDFSEETPFVGGWLLTLALNSQSAEFFIGLLNPSAAPQTQASIVEQESAVFYSAPLSICRSATENGISARLSMPVSLELHRAHYLGSYLPESDGAGVILHHAAAEEQQLRSGDSDLLVQKSLQLSVDDLYLLLVEAIGSGEKLSFRFVSAKVHCDSGVHHDRQLSQGTPLRCLTVNDLPVRNASIFIEEGSFLLKSCE
ncbi:hypothetical protein AB833_11620 [Chromatiales bacterium (ex Bugula neritina AB1)]|nr:hypothetical protein AB833_11620 [Chromatiales bacterium (ex Bugula neritina AB1)]